MKNIVFTGIGSNVGDPEANCLKAIDYLQQTDSSRIISKSSLYKTEPVGYSKQDWFVNCVVKLETEWDIREFLEFSKSIERNFGTKSNIRWGPREIDIDILFYNKRVIDERDLKVPHPMIHKRKFVMIPMLEIEPCFIHPVLGRSMKDLLNDLMETQRVEML